MRQWVPALPIPLCLLLASQAKLVAPVLPVVQRVIARNSLRQARLPSQRANTGALSLIQRFGSTAHLNVPLDCRLMQARAPPFWEMHGATLGGPKPEGFPRARGSRFDIDAAR